MTTEERLGGGYINEVVRIGDTVRRRVAEPRAFVHELLTFMADQHWSGAPRFLGFDDEGREVLSFIDGHVPWRGVDEPAGIWSEESISRAAQLTRELHDLTTDTRLAGDHEVVCHNDLSPKNTVYRFSGRRDGAMVPVAFIDWDLAAPGQRVHDLAHLCWQWACGTTSPVDRAAQLTRIAADAYGCSDGDRHVLIDTILWWQDRCWRGIQAKIDAGDPSAQRLKEAGAVEAVQADWAWTQQHRATLERELYA